MPIPDPFRWLSPVSRKRIWLTSLVISATLLLVMSILDGALKTPAAPSGIISLELAGDFVNAQQILASWDTEARVRAALSLGIDYLFLFAYALFISLACSHFANTLAGKQVFMSQVGFLLAWAQFSAALLDVIENAALIHLLLDYQQEMLASIAWGCAWIKFSLVGMGLAYMAAGFILSRLKGSGKFNGRH